MISNEVMNGTCNGKRKSKSKLGSRTINEPSLCKTLQLPKKSQDAREDGYTNGLMADTTLFLVTKERGMHIHLYMYREGEEVYA